MKKVCVYNWARNPEVDRVLATNDLKHNDITPLSADMLYFLMEELDVMFEHVEPECLKPPGLYEAVLYVDKKGGRFRQR